MDDTNKLNEVEVKQVLIDDFNVDEKDASFIAHDMIPYEFDYDIKDYVIENEALLGFLCYMVINTIKEKVLDELRDIYEVCVDYDFRNNYTIQKFLKNRDIRQNPMTKNWIAI